MKSINMLLICMCLITAIQPGFNWTDKFTFTKNSGSRSIVFSSPTNGIAVGFNSGTTEQGFVALTNDGGENGDYQFITEAGNLNAASFSDENIFYSTGQNFQDSFIFKSTDAGISWFQISFHSTLFFLDGLNFLEGTDSGILFGRKFAGLQIFFTETSDGGKSWSEPEFLEVYPGNIISGSDIMNTENVYLSGGDISEKGLILKSLDAALSVESDYYSSLVEFKVEQNYPNPFNPSTKISYQIPASLNLSKGGTLVTLKVYDILGNEVAILVNEEKPAGTYEVQWDANHLPSGIYFYQLTADEFIETKKMVLMR